MVGWPPALPREVVSPRAENSVQTEKLNDGLRRGFGERRNYCRGCSELRFPTAWGVRCKPRNISRMQWLSNLSTWPGCLNSGCQAEHSWGVRQQAWLGWGERTVDTASGLPNICLPICLLWLDPGFAHTHTIWWKQTFVLPRHWVLSKRLAFTNLSDPHNNPWSEPVVISLIRVRSRGTERSIWCLKSESW